MIEQWLNPRPGPEWQEISGRDGRSYWFLVPADPSKGIWRVKFRNRQIGEVKLLPISPHTLLLADIHLEEGFRGKGLGTALLRAVHKSAGAAGLSEIVGSLVQKDLDAWPGLAVWYEANGYSVVPVTAERPSWSVRSAVSTIRIRL